MEKSEQKKVDSYTAKDIFVLKGLEPVRKRPAMYIGSTGSEGLHHLIWECLDNGIDESISGYAHNIRIELLKDGKIRVSDDGRGIPVDIHPQTKKSALETVMCTLHAGAKFSKKVYQISGGLHGVGVSVVNALSSYAKAEVCRDGHLYIQEYKKGKPLGLVRKIGKCQTSGTKITFEPDPEIFKNREFNLKKIIDHVRQQAFLTPKVRFEIFDLRKEPFFYSFYFEGGIRSFLKYLIDENSSLQKNLFYAKGQNEAVVVEAAFVYTQEIETNELGFVNNIYTPEGGTHITGFRSALTKVLNDWAREQKLLKEKDKNFNGDDVREGLTAVVSIKIPEPQFEGQTKAKLGNPEARAAVEKVISENLKRFLQIHMEEGKRIIGKCLLASRAREAAKKAKETVLRKGFLEGLSLPSKLADCTSNKPEESELFIVEGESAGGCFSGDTKVALADGRNLTFKQLVEEHQEGKRNYCYTVKNNGLIGIEQIKNPRLTKRKVEIIKIVLDNNQKIICTPDHKFMLRDGSYKEAKDIAATDSLMPLSRCLSQIGKRITIKGYEMVFDITNNRWIFTHLLSDDYNLSHNNYSKEDGNTIHHIDFNKLNNNPDNLIRMPKMEHFLYHTKFLDKTIHREDVKEKIRKLHHTKLFREKIRKAMTTPKMRKLLSERAKKQWENEAYKSYMVQKFLEFYKNNKEYRQKSRKILYEGQKIYWNDSKNRAEQSERVKRYFREHPEERKKLSLKSKKQWQNENLLKWRSQKTKEQWTREFRISRKNAYNQTYREKALRLMRDIFETYGDIDKKNYTEKRLEKNDKSLLKYETICKRFFEGDKERMKNAVLNYNHKIKRIIKLRKKIDVYDLEVENTHNFALAAGVFVHNSGKMARDRRTQAILSLKGKVINVEKSRIDKVLANQEIKSLILAIGTGIKDNFDLSKLRYNKIIILSDADVDGAHIRTLLLTLFYRYFKPVVEAGRIYIACPPLYRMQTAKETIYAFTDKEKNAILKFKKGNIVIQRFKGLGEMNPEQLWETTMDPARRKLKQITVEEAAEADRLFDILMGEEVAPRKKFILTYATKVQNLDV